MDDDFIGPQLRDQFDFTLLFEEVIMRIVPAALFICIAPLLIYRLSRKPLQIRAGPLLWTKLILGAAIVAAEAASVVFWGQQQQQRSSLHRSGKWVQLAAAAAALSLLSAVCVLGLVWAQHQYSFRLSMFLSVYLSVSVLSDATYVRSLLRRPGLNTAAHISVVAAALKFCLLLVEEVPKRTQHDAKDNKTITSKETVGGFWNRSVFWWINSTLLSGYRCVLAVDDLHPIDPTLHSETLLFRIENAWTSVNSSSHRLLKASAAALIRPILVGIIPRLLFAVFTFLQPFLLYAIIGAVGDPQLSRDVAGGLIGATVLVYLGVAVSRAWYTHLTFQLLTKLRGSLVSLIFKKTLRLQAGEDAASAAVTHMSTDIDGIVGALHGLHDLWASIIELGVGIFLLTRFVGGATFLVVIPTLASTAAIMYLASKLAPARARWNQKVEERVTATSNALAQLKSIKMMALDPMVSENLQNLRVMEMNFSKKYRVLSVLMHAMATFTHLITPVLVIAGSLFWTQFGAGLTAAQVFTTLSIISLVAQPLTSILVGYPQIWSATGCFTRIQNFLLLPERQEQRSWTHTFRDQRGGSQSAITSGPNIHLHGLQSGKAKRDDISTVSASMAIRFIGVSFALGDSIKPIFKDVDLNFYRSSFTVIIGAVGSGKSALLKAILGEVELCQGTIQIEQAAVAYCGQKPWLRNMSIQENIIGQGIYDSDWYSAVLNACMLNDDLRELPEGDKSLIVSDGSNLSGGQKQRIALARAVYARKNTLLLDDVFSALDQRTATTVFWRLLGEEGILRMNGTTVILATHSVGLLSSADFVVELKVGGTVSVKTSSEFCRLQTRETSDTCNQNSYDADENALSMSSGQVSVDQLPESQIHRRDAVVQPIDEGVAQRHGTGDTALYRFYFQSIEKNTAVAWLIFTTVYIASIYMPGVWIRIWLEKDPSNKLYFIGYAGWSVAGLLLGTIAIGFFFMKLVPKSAESLHKTLLDVVMRQTLWHITSIDAGITLNRFSQDMSLVNQTLPLSLYELTTLVLSNIAMTAIIVSGAQYAATIIPFLVITLYIIQRYYLRTSRQMRHLDLEAKSPLYTIFTEVASGIQYIRAFNWQTEFLKYGLRLLDNSQKPYYLMFCIQRWLTLVLDVCVMSMAVIIVTLALKLRHTTSESAIGLALINVIGFSETLSLLIKSWTELETSLGAISRLRNYVEQTPTEKDPVLTAQVLADWPTQGKIEIDHLSAKYNSNDASANPTLKDITLVIQPGQKVGIVGRTGSGKSTFLLTLLHLLDFSGSILIDGVDIKNVTRQYLRSRITTITQDTVTLPGSVRSNMDPCLPGGLPAGQTEDMITALCRVGLWDSIQHRGGLDADLSSLQLSNGEMQLLCLARAIVHNANTKSRIILVDEATSSMDRDTQERMQLIFREFSDAGCTMVMIAHRADMVRDADLIVELSQGRIISIQGKGNL